MAVVVAVLLSPGPSAAAGPTQEPAPAPPKFKADIKLVIGGEGARWTFTVVGTTDLPDDTILKARVYAVEAVDDFKGGKRIDEESLILEGRGYLLYTVKGGQIRETLLVAPKKPYSLWYRTRLTYDPDVQPAPVLTQAGQAEMTWTADLHHGTPKEFEGELAATLKELTREVEEVQSLFRDLRGKFQVWNRKPDPAAFAEWRKGLSAKVEEIRKRNDQRYSIWAVWLERQAKFRFEAFCDRLDGLCRDFEEWLDAKKKLGEAAGPDELKERQDEEQDRQLRIMHGLAGFLAYFEEAREALGIDTPTDPDVVAAILKDYEAASGDLLALAVQRDAAAWKSKAAGSRDRARRALLKLSSPGLLPRRAYDRVLELTEKFGLYYAVLEKTVAGEKAAPNEAAADHATLISEFRKYAGIK